MTDQSPTLLVNKSELARIFRVALATVDSWLALGCPTKKGGSSGVPYEFDVEAVKAWRETEAERERIAAAERERRISLAQSEMFQGERLAPEGISHVREALEAERLAIIVGQQKGQLVALDDVRADYAAVFGVVRPHMLGWAATLTRAAGLNGQQQEEAERLVRETLIAMYGQIKRPDLRTPSTSIDS